MGRWTDIAAWAGPVVNSGDGDGRPGEPEDRMSGHVGVVIHTAEGSYAGTDSWQRNPAADVGSHFLTAKDGRVEQLIDTDDRSWCQSAGNSTWISIENEGFGSRGESLSPQQVENCARILARAHQVYGVPLQVSNSPSTPGLGWHGMGGAAWGGHYDCPGNAIRAQLPAIVARAAQILTGGIEDMDPNASDIVRGISNAEALRDIWQALIDGRPGGSPTVTRFQFTNGWRMLVDRLGGIDQAVGELRAAVTELRSQPPGSVVITDEQLERVLRRVIGSVDGASPAAS